MRFVFFEPVHTGHHFAYLSRMLPGFVDLPVELILATTPEAVHSDEFARSLQPFTERLQIVTCCTRPPRGKRLRNGWHRLTDLRRAIVELRPDHVAVLYADGIWQVAAVQHLLGRRPWPQVLTVEGWHFRGAFGDAGRRSPKDALERRLFQHMLESGLFARLHMHHEILYDFARKSQSNHQRRTEVVLTADPLVLFDPTEKAEARRRLGLPQDGRIISLSGMISPWKGALLLLEAFQRRAQSPAEANVRLLLAGPHDGQVRDRLRKAPFVDAVRDGSILSLDRYLSEEEMFLTSAASDLVTAPYFNHPGRSSVMLWACAAGRPVLGINRGCIAHVIATEHLGWTCDVHDPAGFAAAIDRALSRTWTASDAARVRRYAQFHRVENYQKISADLLTRRCGLAPVSS